MSIYIFQDEADILPIVIDSGASISITPNLKDFVSEIKPAGARELKGLSNSTKVHGVGMVEWTVRDLYGSTRTIRTKAYYVPKATIRLFSPQTYFEENKAGSLVMDWKRTKLFLADASELEFPYNQGSNLPLMLPEKNFNHAGLYFEDLLYLKEKLLTPEGLMSVADQQNQNLTPAQKELQAWHWKLCHANSKWVQSLMAQPKDKTIEPFLKTKNPRTSSCDIPLCAACQMGKGGRRTPPTKVTRDLKKFILREGDLLPGDAVSIDQYQSSVPGHLPNTKGKEALKDKYNGGTLFYDHATGHIYLENQVSLKAGETIKAKWKFEHAANTCGVIVSKYHADNSPFGSKEF
jgi:hypothetical protein